MGGKKRNRNLHARGRGEREIGRNRTAMEVFQGHRCFLLRHSLFCVSPHPTPLPPRVDLYTNDESPPCPLSLSLSLPKERFALSLFLSLENRNRVWDSTVEMALEGPKKKSQNNGREGKGFALCTRTQICQIVHLRLLYIRIRI